jgi:hypothetical protein
MGTSNTGTSKKREHQNGNIEKLLKSGELGQKMVTSNLTLKVPHFSLNNASKLFITCKEVI